MLCLSVCTIWPVHDLYMLYNNNVSIQYIYKLITKDHVHTCLCGYAHIFIHFSFLTCHIILFNVFLMLDEEIEYWFWHLCLSDESRVTFILWTFSASYSSKSFCVSTPLESPSVSLSYLILPHVFSILNSLPPHPRSPPLTEIALSSEVEQWILQRLLIIFVWSLRSDLCEWQCFFKIQAHLYLRE